MVRHNLCIWITVWIIAIGQGTAMPSYARVLTTDGRADFVRELNRFLPDQPGAIIVTYEAPGKRAGINTAGYDADSGAWFIASQTGCAGREPDGRAYRADVEDAGLSELQPFFAELVEVAAEIPRCYLVAMRMQPEMIVDAELGSDGVWRVLYHAIDPAKTDGRAPWELRVDGESGHVLSNRWTVSEESPVTEYGWKDTAVGLRIRSDPTDRVRTLVDDRADITEFEADRVFQRAKSYRIQADHKLNAVRAGYVQTEDGEWTPGEEPASTEPFGDSLTDRFRTPFIVGGLLILLIGVVQIIRKGRTQ